MLRRLFAGIYLLFATAAAAHPPRGIVVAPDGRIYFSDLERIWAVSPIGRLSVVRRAGDRHTHELVIDSAGNLHGEDSYYDPASQTYSAALWRLNPKGDLTFVHGPRDTHPRGLGVFRNEAGCSFHADQTSAREPLLYRNCPRSGAKLLFGSASAARSHRSVNLSNFGGAAFGPDGSFYFRLGGLIRRLRSGDRVVTVASGVAPENFGIAVDRSAAVYAAEHRNRRIVRIGPTGLRTIPLSAAAPWAPTGLAIRGDMIYVLEVTDFRAGSSARFRVRRKSPGGRVETIAVTPAEIGRGRVR